MVLLSSFPALLIIHFSLSLSRSLSYPESKIIPRIHNSFSFFDPELRPPLILFRMSRSASEGPSDPLLRDVAKLPSEMKEKIITPWLMEYTEGAGTGIPLPADPIRLFSVTDGTMATIDTLSWPSWDLDFMSEWREKYLHGPCIGYALVSCYGDGDEDDDEEKEYSNASLNAFVNLLAGHIVWVQEFDTDIPYTGVSCSLSGDTMCARIRLLDGNWVIAVYKEEWDQQWRYFRNCLPRTCCYGNRLCTTIEHEDTIVFDAKSGAKTFDDLESGTVVYTIKPPEFERRHPIYVTESFFEVRKSFLVLVGTELMRIVWILKSEDDVQNSRFRLFKQVSEIRQGEAAIGEAQGQGELQADGRIRQYWWIEIENLENNKVVFLDVSTGFSMTAPHGVKANSIYFLMDDRSSPCRYDIRTATVHPLGCPFNSSTWFVPSTRKRKW